MPIYLLQRAYLHFWYKVKAIIAFKVFHTKAEWTYDEPISNVVAIVFFTFDMQKNNKI